MNKWKKERGRKVTMIDNSSSAMALAEQSKKEEIEKKHQATEKAIDRSISLSALEELKKQNKELYNQITNNNL